MIVEKSIHDVNDESYTIYTCKNDSIYVELLDFGATIKDIKLKGQDGHFESILLTYSSVEEFINKNIFYYGSTVGRYSGRINNKGFYLNNVFYPLEQNSDGKTSLHGGPRGFSLKKWNAKTYINKNKAIVDFELFIPHLEDGCPGNLITHIIYIIDSKSITIEFKATCDMDTILNITNHSYYNLSGSRHENLNEHELFIDSDYYYELDKNFCPIELKSVHGTFFDYRNFTYIKNKNLENTDNCNSELNHPYLLNNSKSIIYKVSKLNNFMKITTSYPFAVIYTNGYGQDFNKYKGICFECQFLPNDINFLNNPQSILKKGDYYNHFIKLEFNCSFK